MVNIVEGSVISPFFFFFFFPPNGKVVHGGGGGAGGVKVGRRLQETTELVHRIRIIHGRAQWGGQGNGRMLYGGTGTNVVVTCIFFFFL